MTWQLQLPCPKHLQPPRTGRPTLYTQETVDRLLNAISCGLTQVQAYKACGICQTTFRRWRELYPELNERIEEAREQARLKALLALKIAGEDDWRATEAFLKYSFHADYRRDTSVEVNVSNDNRSINVSDPERARLIEQRRLALEGKD